MCSIERKKHMTVLELEARIILNKYSYPQLNLACQENEGPPELLQCLRNIFLSIIEDWIQDYIIEREEIDEIDEIEKKNDLWERKRPGIRLSIKYVV